MGGSGPDAADIEFEAKSFKSYARAMIDFRCLSAPREACRLIKLGTK